MKIIKKRLKPALIAPALTAMLMTFGMALAIEAASKPAWADIEPVLKEAGWDEITFDDQPSNQFTPLDENQPDLWGGVALESNQSVSIAFFLKLMLI